MRSRIPSDGFMDEESHHNVVRDPFPSRVRTPRRILIGSFVVDPPFFQNVVGFVFLWNVDNSSSSL